jgi:DNA mismatch repair protein MutS
MSSKASQNKPQHQSIVIDYLQQHELYRPKYGCKSLVLMQVGSFYEAYSTDLRGPNLHEISNLINIVCTRKDKSINDISEKNPYMMGFNLISAQKFISILINNGFTLIMIDQVSPPPNVIRKVTNIYSPSTYLENINTRDTNYTICIYLEDEPQKQTSNLLCSGMSAIDLSTGKSYTYEALSNTADPKYALDETVRFINSLNPTETIIYYTPKPNSNMTADQLISYLELGNKNYLYKNTLDKQYLKLSYQNEFLKNIYNNNGIISPIEYLDLDRTNYSRLSFILLLQFAYEHNINITKDINKPEPYMNDNYMILGNNAIYQLDIIENNIYNEKRNTKFKSLYDVVNNASTSQGRRYLKDRLVSPIISPKKLENIYKHTEELIENKLYIKLEDKLKLIADIERLYRKMSLNILHPHELVILHDSLNEVINLYNVLSKTNKLTDIIPNQQNIETIEELTRGISRIFNIDELKKYSLNNITNTFFNKSIHQDIDKITEETQIGKEFMDELCNKLNEYIQDNKAKNTSKISVKKNLTDKYYLSLSKPRAGLLQENLQCVEHIIIQNMKINIKDLIFTNNKTVSKITLNIANNDVSDELSDKDDLICILTKKYYLEHLTELYNNYGSNIRLVNDFVSYLDYIKSNAKTAILYNYTKPIINNINNASYIECKQIRHPIIERIIDYEYHPHDISLGKELKGMLIYGTNSSGKSSIMKSVGMSLILAQSGMFVPAENFIYYPYDALYTRITGLDNIFRGLSSFAVEMLELKAILRRSNSNTLVLGDEVCHGTENISANAIVASTIVKLSELNSSFMFATHLHEIASMKRIQDLNKVKSYHISIDYDEKNDTLIYDRKLKEGSGESIYGITFARYMIHDSSFIELAVDIKNELLHKYNEFIPNKPSKYNSDVYISACSICGKQNSKSHISPLETHHIIPQKDFQEEKAISKPHIKKNSKANLLVLCTECHDKHHRGEINIEKYIMTSKGRRVKTTKI